MTSKRRALPGENAESANAPARVVHIEMDRLYAELRERRDRLAAELASNLGEAAVERHVTKYRLAQWRTSLEETEKQYGVGSAVHAAIAHENPFDWETLRQLEPVFLLAAILAEIQTLNTLARALTRLAPHSTSSPPTQGA